MVSHQCRCPPVIRKSNFHVYGEEMLLGNKSRGPTKLEEILLHLIGVRCDPIQAIDTVGLPFKALAKRKRWPTCPQDLLPHGPLDTIRGWLSWLGVGAVPGHEVRRAIQLFHSTVRLTHPITLPYLLESRAALIQSFTSLTTEACNMLAKADTTRERDRKARLLEDAFTVLAPGSECMLEILVAWCDRAQRRRFAAGDALLLLTVYNRARRLCELHHARGSPHVKAAQCVTHYTILESTIASDCIAWGIHTPPSIEQHAWLPIKYGSVWAQTAALFGRLHRAQRCAAPDCTRTWADPLPFKRCGGCRRLTYCSRGCQKRAWDHPVAPHRAICGTIRAVCLTYGLPRAKSAADWVAYMAKKDEPRGFNETQAQFLLDQCAAQTQYELETSRTSLGSRNANRSAHARDSAVRGRAEGMMSGMQNM
jgi:hypothetical protein